MLLGELHLCRYGEVTRNVRLISSESCNRCVTLTTALKAVVKQNVNFVVLQHYLFCEVLCYFLNNKCELLLIRHTCSRSGHFAASTFINFTDFFHRVMYYIRVLKLIKFHIFYYSNKSTNWMQQFLKFIA
jgi:hypothetical protein